MKNVFLFLLLIMGIVSFGQTGKTCTVCPPSLNGVTTGWVLTDSAGHAKWQVVGGGGAGSFWKTTGNSGTTAGTNFIGTTDNVSFSFRVNNVASGFMDADNTGNTSFGYSSMLDPANSFTNTAFGKFTLSIVTIGSGNNAFGGTALGDNTEGNNNVAIGTNSLTSNVTGNANIGTGNNSLSNNVDGGGNVGVGDGSLGGNISGSNNTGIGNNALNSTTGTGNIGIGYNANVSGGFDNSLAFGSISLNNSNQIGFSDNYTTLYLNLNTGSSASVLTNDGSGNASWTTNNPTQLNGVSAAGYLLKSDSSSTYATKSFVQNSYATTATTSTIVASADLTAQAAGGTITTYNTASTGTYRVGGYVNVTAIVTNVITLKVTYTDENSGSVTQIIPLTLAATGAVSTTATIVGNNSATDIQIRVKTGTTITVLTTATGVGSETFDTGVTIEKMR